MSRSVLVLGPNGVGKTKYAFGLARENDGAVINLDRTYLYRGFPITTGLHDTLQETAVERHLYEVLDPEEPSYETSEFLKLVIKKRDQALETRSLVVAEGASTVYVPALLEFNLEQKIFDRIIGLRFSKGFDIESKYRARIEDAFQNGLVAEISENLFRYENSFLIKECHFAVPTVKYLKGQITLSNAKEEILQRCLIYKDRQLELFSQFKQIEWIEI